MITKSIGSNNLMTLYSQKLIIWPVSLLLSFNYLFAQNKIETKFGIVPAWESGQKFNYVFTRSEYSEKNTPDFTLNALGAFQIILKNESGYKIQCKFSSQNKFYAESSVLLYAINGLEVNIETDSRGALKGVSDIEKVREQCKKFLVESRNKGSADKYLIQELLKEINSDGYIKEVVLQDLRLLFVLNGYEFNLGKMEVINRRVENFIDNHSIKKIDKYKLDKVDSIRKNFIFNVESKCDSNEIKPIIITFLEKMARELDEPLPNEARTATYKLEDVGIIDVDMETRNVQSVIYRRELASNLFYQGFKITIKRIK